MYQPGKIIVLLTLATFSGLGVTTFSYADHPHANTTTMEESQPVEENGHTDLGNRPMTEHATLGTTHGNGPAAEEEAPSDAGGAAKGCAAGAAIGSALAPGVGTVAGCVIAGIWGWFW